MKAVQQHVREAAFFVVWWFGRLAARFRAFPWMKTKAALLGPLQVIGQSSPATRSSPSATPTAPKNIVNANKRTDLRVNSFNTVCSHAYSESDLPAEEVDGKEERT
jgi:hypothetical protein